jgi:hypothetical protein
LVSVLGGGTKTLAGANVTHSPSPDFVGSSLSEGAFLKSSLRYADPYNLRRAFLRLAADWADRERHALYDRTVL